MKLKDGKDVLSLIFMNKFNIKVQNDNIINDKEFLLYLFDCIYNKNKVELFIDESPDLECICLGHMYLIDFLEDVCQKFSIDKKDIAIKIENLIQSNCWPNIERCYESIDVFHGQNVEHKVDKTFKYKTSILVGGSRWPRLALASFLYKYYADDSLITYWQNLKDKNQPCYLYIDDVFKYFNPVNESFIKQIKEFIAVLPLHLESKDREKNNNGGFINFTESYELVHQYNNIFCDIICETVHNGSTFAFTEKIARCWLTKTPYIAFGPKNYLNNLKKLGFQSFAKFWNEAYDQHSNSRRIIMMQQLIKYIHTMNYKTIDKLYAEMQDVLDNNYKVFKSLTQEQIKKAFNIT